MYPRAFSILQQRKKTGIVYTGNEVWTKIKNQLLW
jgi:hypothetical protein